MKRLRILRRWFARRFGFARLVCLALLIGLAALRIADPAPVEELRVRTFDTFQLIEPRIKTARPVTIVDIDEKSLAQARPMAVAADAGRRSGHQSDQARRRRDRLRRRVRRARPAQSRRRGRHLPQSRRGDAGQVARAAEQRSDFRRCHAALARGAGRIRACPLCSRPRQDAAGDRACDAGRRSAAFHVRISRACCATSRCWKQAAAGRGLFTIKPERDGIVRRVPMVMHGAGQTMPSLSFEMLRVATGTGTILIKADEAGIKSVGVQGFEMPTDRNGQLWVHFARTIPRSMSRRSTCSKAASRRTRSRTSWC